MKLTEVVSTRKGIFRLSNDESNFNTDKSQVLVLTYDGVTKALILTISSRGGIYQTIQSSVLTLNIWDFFIINVDYQQSLIEFLWYSNGALVEKKIVKNFKVGYGFQSSSSVFYLGGDPYYGQIDNQFKNFHFYFDSTFQENLIVEKTCDFNECVSNQGIDYQDYICKICHSSCSACDESLNSKSCISCNSGFYFRELRNGLGECLTDCGNSYIKLEEIFYSQSKYRISFFGETRKYFGTIHRNISFSKKVFYNLQFPIDDRHIKFFFYNSLYF